MRITMLAPILENSVNHVKRSMCEPLSIRLALSRFLQIEMKPYWYAVLV